MLVTQKVSTSAGFFVFWKCQGLQRDVDQRCKNMNISVSLIWQLLTNSKNIYKQAHYNAIPKVSTRAAVCVCVFIVLGGQHALI